jgi:hypothetical protein
MTIVTQSTKAVLQGNGANTVFPYTFPIPTTSDIVVTLVELATGAETVLTPSQFSVTGIGGPSGGNVTYPLSGSPLSASFDLVIQRIVDYEQQTDLVNQGGAYPEDIEDALDFLTMQTQQLAELMDRAVLFSVADSASGTLPNAAARANKAFTFDATGAPTASAFPSGVVAISAAMIPVVGASTTAIALQLLGVSAGMLPFVAAANLEAARGTLGFYNTFADAQAASIDATIDFLQTAGYTSVGDLGGVTYKRVVGGSVQLTTADGAQWRIYSSILTPQMFGAVAGGNISTAMTAAFTAAAALNIRKIFIPAGSYFMTAQAAYVTSTSVVSTFAPGIEVFGAGMGSTIIDNRVAAGTPMLAFSHSVALAFQIGTYIHDFTITNTTAVALTRGIELKALYNSCVQRVHTHNNRIGISLSCQLGDSDASINVLYDQCRFEGGSYGLYSDMAAAVTQCSFIRATNCFFTLMDAAGWYYIGFQGSMYNCAFAAIDGVGLQMIYNGANNTMFTADTCSFENCETPSIQINSLVGGSFKNIELANTVFATYPSTQGVNFGNGSAGVAYNIKFEQAFVRVSAAYNPMTMFVFASNSGGCEVANTFWTSFDGTGQVRSTDAGNSNRAIDDAITVGTLGGITTLVLSAGANDNVLINLEGEFFIVTGPGAPFNVTGFQRGSNGRRYILYNSTGQPMTLTHSSGSSSVGNRILGTAGANTVVASGSRVELVYANAPGGGPFWHVLSVG